MLGFRVMLAAFVAGVVASSAYADETTHSVQQHGADTQEHNGAGTVRTTVGPVAPGFTLDDAAGKKVSLSDYRGKIVVLEWTNSECPFVQRHYASGTMKTLAAKYADKGVVWLAINSTNTNRPLDSFRWAEMFSLPYPTLQDPDGKVGKAYGAKATPHMFVIDKDGRVAYQGAIDDDPAGEKGSVAVNYLQAALDHLLKSEPPEITRTTPYGCPVKYRD
jgi:peroxiredoxin